MKAIWLSFIYVNSLVGVCEISIRDQALLIAKSRMWPFPGFTSVSDIAGSQVECISVGRMVVVHFPGVDFLAILDKTRIFSKWDYTGSSPGIALDSVFANYAERMSATEPHVLQRIYGNRYRFPDELVPEIRSRIRSGFEQVTLLPRDQYGRVQFTRVRPDRLKDIVDRSLPKRVADWIARVEGEPIDRLTISAPEIRWLSIDETVKVSYRRTKSGETVQRFLLIPVNVEIAPFVGEPQELVDLSKGK